MRSNRSAGLGPDSARGRREAQRRNIAEASAQFSAVCGMTPSRTVDTAATPMAAIVSAAGDGHGRVRPPTAW